MKNQDFNHFRDENILKSLSVNISLKNEILNKELRAKILKEGIGFLKPWFPNLEASDENIIKLLGWDSYHQCPVFLINDFVNKYLFKKGMSGKGIVPKGCSTINLYPLELFKSLNKEQVFICKCEKDALNLIQSGYTAITLGIPNGYWSKHLSVLADCDELVLIFDADPAGEQARDKAINDLKYLQIHMSYVDFSKLSEPIKKGYDVSDFLKEHQASELLLDPICIKIEKDKNLKVTFEKLLSIHNISVFYDEDKNIYLVIDNEDSKILHTGSKNQIYQILISKFRKLFSAYSYCKFTPCHTFYSPSGKLPKIKKTDTPINVYQKPIFPLSAKPIVEIPPTIKILLDNLFQDKTQLYYFLNWLACFLQTGEKSQIAFVIISLQGVGKGTLGRIIEKLFGEENCIEVTNSMIEGNFNDFMFQKQMLILNEINTVNDVSSRKHLKNKLKSLITDPTVWVNPKGRKGFTINNVFNILVTTNETHPIDVEEDDRRFVVINSMGVPLYEAMGSDYLTYEPLIMSEVPDFYNFLMNCKCDFKKYNMALETEYKSKLKALSQTLDERIALAIAKKDFEYFEANLQESLYLEATVSGKVGMIQELKDYLEKLFVPNEFICRLYKGVKGAKSDFCTPQEIKHRLQKTGVLEKYQIVEKQTTLNGKSTRGLQFPS